MKFACPKPRHSVGVSAVVLAVAIVAASSSFGRARACGPVVVDLELSASTIDADGNDEITLTATVREISNGNPVEGVEVLFDADYRAEMVPNGSVTNADGVITCSYSTIDDGNYYVYADPLVNGVGDSKPIQAVVAGSTTVTLVKPAAPATVTVGSFVTPE